MCYLVTYFKPAKSTEMNIIQTEEFEKELEAKTAAGKYCFEGCTNVRVWGLKAQPRLSTQVQWDSLTAAL